VSTEKIDRVKNVIADLYVAAEFHFIMECHFFLLKIEPN